MQIVIPSYRRAGHLPTYEAIPHEFKDRTCLAVRGSEAGAYHGYYPRAHLLYVPDEMQGIADTRDFIVEKIKDEKILMMDDDLTFAARRTDDPTRFRACSLDDISGLLSSLECLLDDYAHISVSPREGANRNTEHLSFNTRAMRVLGYRRSVLLREGVLFAPATFMCDFHATLVLLRAGHANAVLNTFCHNQPGSNTRGGCSEQRTPDTQKEAAEWLARMHPEFVTVVQKETKTSWKGESRYDVRVQWKRAYLSGASREANGLDERTGDSPGT